MTSIIPYTLQVNTESHLSTIKDAHVGGHVAANIKKLNGNTIDTNSGINSDGTMRVTLATDDQTAENIATMAANISGGAANTNLVTLNGNIISVDTGTNGNGTLRVTLATDDTTAVKISSIENVLTSGITTTDVISLNGQAVSLNAGNLANGVQRVCIATDDVNLSAISTAASNISTNTSNTATNTTNLPNVIKTLGTDTYTEATTKGVMICGVRNDSASVTLAGTNNELCPFSVSQKGAVHTSLRYLNEVGVNTNSGNNSSGVLRVCLATDDINAAAINTSTSTTATNTTSISSSSSSTATNTSTTATNTTNIATSTASTATSTSSINTNTTDIPNVIKTLGSSTYSEGVTKGVMICAVRNDNNINVLVDNNNEISPIAVDAYGAISASNPSLEARTNGYGGQASYATGDKIIRIGGVSNESQSGFVGGDNDYGPIAIDSKSNVLINQMRIRNATIAANSGSLSDGCQRVAIATDDVNLSAINTAVTNMNTTLTNIYNILNSWNSAGGASAQARVNVI